MSSYKNVGIASSPTIIVFGWNYGDDHLASRSLADERTGVLLPPVGFMRDQWNALPWHI
jgi:hypothetical protein